MHANPNVIEMIGEVIHLFYRNEQQVLHSNFF